ncbi:MAG: hypothetical protein ACXV3T_06860 [Halobacteriota archaeon]
MYPLTRQALRASVLLGVFFVVSSAVAFGALTSYADTTSLRPTTLSFAEGSVPTDSTVLNVVTISSPDISLGSVLHAQGKASITTVAIDVLPLYILVALVIVVVLISSFLLLRGRGARARPAATTPAPPTPERTEAENSTRAMETSAPISEREQPAVGALSQSERTDETIHEEITSEPDVWIRIESTPQARVSVSTDNLVLPATLSEREQYPDGESSPHTRTPEPPRGNASEPNVWIKIESTPQVHVAINKNGRIEPAAPSEPNVRISIESTPQAHIAFSIDNLALPPALLEPTARIRIESTPQVHVAVNMDNLTQPSAQPEGEGGAESETPPSGPVREQQPEQTEEQRAESESDALHKYGVAVSMDSLTQPSAQPEGEGGAESGAPESAREAPRTRVPPFLRSH